jgi:hypothetical protein
MVIKWNRWFHALSPGKLQKRFQIQRCYEAKIWPSLTSTPQSIGRKVAPRCLLSTVESYFDSNAVKEKIAASASPHSVARHGLLKPCDPDMMYALVQRYEIRALPVCWSTSLVATTGASST